MRKFEIKLPHIPQGRKTGEENTSLISKCCGEGHLRYRVLTLFRQATCSHQQSNVALLLDAMKLLAVSFLAQATDDACVSLLPRAGLQDWTSSLLFPWSSLPSRR
jgi:hypothetical protein